MKSLIRPALCNVWYIQYQGRWIAEALGDDAFTFWAFGDNPAEAIANLRKLMKEQLTRVL